MKRMQRGYAVAAALIWAVIVLAGLGGWIANIVKLVGMDFGHVTGMLVVRAIGILVAPLGAVLGFL